MEHYEMACDTCASIASNSGGSPVKKQERSVSVNCGSLKKSAENGCLSCSLIQGIVQAGRTGESQTTSIHVRVDKDGYICASVGYLVTGASYGVQERLYPFTVRETPWDLIPIDESTNPDPPTFESAIPLIQSWMQRCDLHHSCFKHGLGIASKLPTRVVDVGDSSHDPHLHITQGETGRFVALSHCWGEPQTPFKRLATTQTNLSEHCDGIALDKFPGTFRDAINITRGLGLRYIWIDSLCIIQDSPEDWILEVNRMAEVYLNAYITLAADLAPHSDAGLFIANTYGASSAPKVRQFNQVDHTGTCQQIFVTRNWPMPGKNRRRGDAEDHRSCYASEAASKLAGRAWVLQENILSARTVHFTNAELVWECGDSYECSCGYPMATRSIKSVFENVLQCSTTAISYTGETSIVAPSIWHSVVEEFTARDLTYAEDALPALSSLARMLPFPENDYLAGLWRNSLMDDLLWLNPLGHLTWDLDNSSDDSMGLDTLKQKNYRIQGEYAPSWSWASVCAPTAFKIDGDIVENGIIPEWKLTGASCMPTTKNPYGPVSKDSSLHVEGYVLPITFSDSTTTESTGDQNGNHHADGELYVVCGEKAFPGRNKMWLDAGGGGQEWRVEGFAYFALVIGCRRSDKTPFALVLRERECVGSKDEYTRIGFVCLDNWKDHEWNIGAEKRAITIF